MVGLKLEEIDSGMESLPESSKDMTPEKIPVMEDDYEVKKLFHHEGNNESNLTDANVSMRVHRVKKMKP